MGLFEIFENSTVLITGHTGFKGSWLAAWLKKLGSRVIGVSLDPPTVPSHFATAGIALGIDDLRMNICDQQALIDVVVKYQPDFVFHLAAQPLVRRSHENPVETWRVNVMGTLNLLEALRALKKNCVAVFITSDKCYNNVEWEWGYRETDVLGGPDPYSASKAAAELAVNSHIRSYFPKESSNIRIATARAGNVIGGGDWAKDRVVPDCMVACSNDRKVSLRNPHSTRPWQHVLEPLSGYLNLAAALMKKPFFHGEPFNFGPSPDQNRTVLQLVQEMAKHWGRVSWRDLSVDGKQPYESGLLKLNCDKALHHLRWKACLPFEDTVRMTVEWYRLYYQNDCDMETISSRQIIEYTNIASEIGLAWA